MALSDLLVSLPDGYFVEEAPHGVLAVHADVARSLHEAGYGPESDCALERAELVGRAPLFEVRLGEARYLVRRFRHGGLLRRLTGRRFLDAERPFRELVLVACRVGAQVTLPDTGGRADMNQPACIINPELDIINKAENSRAKSG